MTRKDFFITEIVADRGQRRRVGGQGNRGPRATLFFITTNQLGGDMLRIGCAAAIPAKQDFLSAGERIADHLARSLDIRQQRV